MSPGGDTIFALSSGRPPAAIAVIRVSGPDAGNAMRALTSIEVAPRSATLAMLRDPGSGEALDQALVLWFPGPASETGEDTAEFQVHGGRAVIAAMLAALGRIAGLRPAEPGEFTRRALANGRLDLTAVEGIADLVGAETEAQRRQALGQLRGLLGGRAETWRIRMVEALARIEAALDFSDEGDVPADVRIAAVGVASLLADEIRAVLAQARRGERLREGLTVAIAGPVNAGKSSIFNWIAGREAAIVSPHPGTTRDVLEVNLDLGGYPVTVLDTAGVRTSDDPVEQEGVRRAQARAAQADLVLWVEDATTRSPDVLPGRPSGAWQVWNKTDRLDTAMRSALSGPQSGTPSFLTSAASGEGLSALMSALEGFAAEALGSAEPTIVTRARQREALQQALAALERAQQVPEGNEELTAEELRLAAHALGRLLGRIDVEDVLDAIFRDFCIGK
jgi:tRNA modification GTPase